MILVFCFVSVVIINFGRNLLSIIEESAGSCKNEKLTFRDVSFHFVSRGKTML